MGLLIAWGDDANFVLSVGGFHPTFTPPPLPFPSPAASVDLDPQRVVRTHPGRGLLRRHLEHGAVRRRGRALLRPRASSASRGTSASTPCSSSRPSTSSSRSRRRCRSRCSASACSASASAASWKAPRRGTSRARARSRCSSSTSTCRSRTRWGESADTVLPAIPALPILQARAARSATTGRRCPGRKPASRSSLRKIEATDELVLHPLGTLQISQRAVPLDLSIQKIGNQTISDIEQATLKVADARAGARSRCQRAVRHRAVPGHRRRGQAVRPGYEKQDARASSCRSPAPTRARSHAVKRIVLHELIIIDNNFKEHVQRFFNVGMTGSPTSSAATPPPARRCRRRARRRRSRSTERVTAETPGLRHRQQHRQHRVMSGRHASPARPRPRTSSPAQISADPADGRRLHVIPAAEARGGMSDPIGTYTFLPWLRQGIANRIGAGDSSCGRRVAVQIDIEVTKKGGGDGDADRDRASATSSCTGPATSSASSAAADQPHGAAALDHQLRAQLPPRDRVLRRGLAVALHARRTGRPQAAAVAGAGRPRGEEEFEEGGNVSRQAARPTSRSRPTSPTSSRPPPSCGHGPTCTSTPSSPTDVVETDAAKVAQAAQQVIDSESRHGLLAAALPAQARAEDRLPRLPHPGLRERPAGRARPRSRSAVFDDPANGLDRHVVLVGAVREPATFRSVVPVLPPLVFPHRGGRRLRVAGAPAQAEDRRQPGRPPRHGRHRSRAEHRRHRRPRARRHAAPRRRAQGAAGDAQPKSSRTSSKRSTSGPSPIRTSSRSSSPPS